MASDEWTFVGFRVVGTEDGAGSDHRPIVAQLRPGLTRTRPAVEQWPHGRLDFLPRIDGHRRSRPEAERQPFDHSGLDGVHATTSPRSGPSATETLPSPREVAPYAAARRLRISALHPGERLIIPAGPAKVRSQRHRLRVPRALRLQRT